MTPLSIIATVLAVSGMFCVAIAIVWKVRSIIGPGVLELIDENSSEPWLGIGPDMSETDMDKYIRHTDGLSGDVGGRSE